MIRSILARAIGVLLGAMGLATFWNGLAGLRYTDGLLGHIVLGLYLLAGPVSALGGYRLWRRDRRALPFAIIALVLGIAAGTLSAGTYTPGPDRTSATLGALAGGLVFGVAVVGLAHLALRTPPAETTAPSQPGA